MFTQSKREELEASITYWSEQAEKLEDGPYKTGILKGIAQMQGELTVLADLPADPTPEAQALQAKAQEQRQIAANMRAQATADAILQTLPTDPTPDDHDAVAERLERAAAATRTQSESGDTL